LITIKPLRLRRLKKERAYIDRMLSIGTNARNMTERKTLDMIIVIFKVCLFSSLSSRLWFSSARIYKSFTS
jgi:hypothetical protein